ncbi:SipW-dependent-type signal peptide-containing protein [Microbacterium sp. JB110]|uniref:SipW-dependent-type signal peptide-containing protein n=1 Tax=Microbacterium sp. JB110 TaxID=2024477 RepID=UPI00097F18A3|nr:SipW-dependent-type signal peptide-containing protein [Microbacterium sp. JB110]RCS61315.1 hypothetical protein CIK77_07310 [Microbacterium sp. JB110]SJM50882.1 hypothetical protein CZ774_04850 [Frigoribacterium sp. JB110]
MVKTADRRKVLAVLAGGLVLGVGTAVTLAAWNDSEFATGDFAAGTFVFQGSTDNETFEDHTSQEGAAALTFETGADNLAPGDTVYEAYALRVTGSYDAELEAVAPIGSGDFATAGKLSFDAVATTAFGCDETAFAGGSAVPDVMEQGTDVYLCLQVTAEDALEQGDAGSVLWQWNAESVQ